MIVAVLLSVVSIAKSQPIPTNCTDPNFPPCQAWGSHNFDILASFRVPGAPIVPAWVNWAKQQAAKTEAVYPWINLTPTVGPCVIRDIAYDVCGDDGGQTPGGPNGNGVAWEAPGNLASEVYDCPAGTVNLSYDDGPVLTNDILPALAAANAKATFYYVGSTIVNDPAHKQALQNAYKAGHQIAMHSWSHRQLSLLTNEELISEIVLNALAIYNVIGVVPRYIRPPYSAINDRVRNVIYTLGLRPVVWTIESQDAGIGGPGAGALENQLLTVDVVTEHVRQSLIDQYDPRWNYFPSSNGKTAPNGRYIYDGQMILEHELTPEVVAVAKNVIGFVKNYAPNGLVLAPACDRVLPNASPYLPADAPFAQLIAGIKLPLTQADVDGTAGPAVTTVRKTTAAVPTGTLTVLTTKTGAGFANKATLFTLFAVVALLL